MSGSETAPEATRLRHKCARCGIESSEPTCFVIPRRYAEGPTDTRCIACEVLWRNRRLPRRMAGVFLALVIIALALVHPAINSAIGALAAAILLVLLLPVALLIHELGHALVAWMLRLEVGAILVGAGPQLFATALLGVPLRIRYWPLYGSVIVGIAGGPLQRLRLWLVTLAGPAANGLAAWATVHFGAGIASPAGSLVATLWVVLNFFLCVGNLMPFRFGAERGPQRSDGLALFQIPWTSKQSLQPYRTVAPITRLGYRFELRQYASACGWAYKALAREPDNGMAIVSLSACLIRMGKFKEGRRVLAPLMSRATLPVLQALARNNEAIALLLDNQEPCKPDADRLSAEAFEAFPCLLSVRSSRALVLIWLGKPEQALELLKYRHYDMASAEERADQALAQALALRQLGFEAEAVGQMAKARALGVEQLPELEQVLSR
jgi:Peptidase family M50